MLTRTRLFLALLLSIVGATHSAGQPATTLTLGSNLAEVNDYSPQLPFLNLFLSSREWLTQCRAGQDAGCTNQNAFDTEEAGQLDLDAHGWVRSLPASSAAPIFTQVATFWDVPAEFAVGEYVVLYDGSGVIEYGLAARKVDSSSQTPGRDIVEVDPSRGGILLRITSTDPAGNGDYIRNIRFVIRSDEAQLATQSFTTSFLNQIRPYQVVRFMDWMRTNNSTVSSWGARSLPTDARFSTSKGVPIETMIELANTARVAPWFTIPHQATDDYVARFALLTKASLASDLPVFVEYSNEAWNPVFTQGAYMEQRGQDEWGSSGESGFTKRINFYGKRSAEVCRLWKQSFAEAGARVVCVMASQAANSWTADQALRCPLWGDGPCVSQGISALAIAPYFGDYLGQEDAEAQVSGWSSASDAGLTRLFSELNDGGQLSGGPTGGALAQSFQWMSENLTVANTHSVALITYEGGQHLVGVGTAQNNSALTNLFTSANGDQRMRSLYDRYLQGWSERAGGLFMHFSDIGSYSKFGSWGALETLGQNSSPKYDALRAYSPIRFSDDPNTTKAVLSVRTQGRGKVTSSPAGLSCGTRCSLRVAQGSVVTLTAKAKRGYRFGRWTGACRGNRRRCAVTMTRSRRVRASFERSR